MSRTVSRSVGDRHMGIYIHQNDTTPPFDYETSIRVYANNSTHIANEKNWKKTDFSNRLRSARKAAGLTQFELGELCEAYCQEHGYHFGGKSPDGALPKSRASLIAQYETNRCTAKIDNMTPLAHSLNRTLEYMMGQDDCEAYLGCNGFDQFMSIEGANIDWKAA